jgi:hypothetical protein
MSQVKIRAALETAVNAMTPAILTAWENNAFPNVNASITYQVVTVLFATPDDLVTLGGGGAGMHTENGLMVVNLRYPLQTGDGAARARAELLKTTFRRGTSFTNNGVTVIINRTPEAGAGIVDGDHWSVPVKIRFYSNV